MVEGLKQPTSIPAPEQLRKQEKLLSKPTAGAQAVMLLGIEPKQSLNLEKDYKEDIKNLAEKGIPTSHKEKIKNASFNERNEYWEKKTDISEADRLNVWKRSMDSFLDVYKEDLSKTAEHAFLRKILDLDSQEELGKVNAQAFYDAFIEKGKGDVEFFARRIAENFRGDEIEKNQDLIKNLGNMYGENSAKISELLTYGISNGKNNLDGFVKSAQENLDKGVSDDDRNVWVELDKNSKAWDEGQKQKEDAGKAAEEKIRKEKEELERKKNENKPKIIAATELNKELELAAKLEEGEKGEFENRVIVIPESINKRLEEMANVDDGVEREGLLFYKKGKEGEKKCLAEEMIVWGEIKDGREEYYPNIPKIVHEFLSKNREGYGFIEFSSRPQNFGEAEAEKFPDLHIDRIKNLALYKEDRHRMYILATPGKRTVAGIGDPNLVIENYEGYAEDNFVSKEFKRLEEEAKQKSKEAKKTETTIEPSGVDKTHEEIKQEVSNFIEKIRNDNNEVPMKFLGILESFKDFDNTSLPVDTYRELVDEAMDVFDDVTAKTKLGGEIGMKLRLNSLLMLYDTFYFKNKSFIGGSTYYKKRIALFEQCLKDEGVEKIEDDIKGKKFDPESMLNIGVEEIPDDAKGYVVKEERLPGFNFGGKILRERGVILEKIETANRREKEQIIKVAAPEKIITLNEDAKAAVGNLDFLSKNWLTPDDSERSEDFLKKSNEIERLKERNYLGINNKKIKGLEEVFDKDKYVGLLRQRNLGFFNADASYFRKFDADMQVTKDNIKTADSMWGTAAFFDDRGRGWSTLGRQSLGKESEKVISLNHQALEKKITNKEYVNGVIEVLKYTYDNLISDKTGGGVWDFAPCAVAFITAKMHLELTAKEQLPLKEAQQSLDEIGGLIEHFKEGIDPYRRNYLQEQYAQLKSAIESQAGGKFEESGKKESAGEDSLEMGEVKRKDIPMRGRRPDLEDLEEGQKTVKIIKEIESKNQFMDIDLLQGFIKRIRIEGDKGEYETAEKIAEFANGLLNDERVTDRLRKIREIGNFSPREISISKEEKNDLGYIFGKTLMLDNKMQSEKGIDTYILSKIIKEAERLKEKGEVYIAGILFHEAERILKTEGEEGGRLRALKQAGY